MTTFFVAGKLAKLQGVHALWDAWVEGDRAGLPAAFVHLVDWVLQDTDIWHIR